MKIGVLTSSRADYGIYVPLLKKLKVDNFFDLEIIAFGTHLSNFHGYTVKMIEEEGFNVIHKISSLLTADDQQAISTAFGLTALKFADFWALNSYDLVLCLGDRFEMCAAVQAGIPFGVKFAHLHGGETTLGAVDNIYRHQITLASDLHFASIEDFANRIKDIKGDSKYVYSVGSLSIEEIEEIDLPSENEFRHRYGILNPFILATFHPETVSPENIYQDTIEMINGLKAIANRINIVITMPNADTFGTIFRDALTKLKEEMPNEILLIENFGKVNYFAAMKFCELLLGNTSSGIIEAASFGKYVVNVGHRQAGRAQSQNTINCDFDALKMQNAVNVSLAKGKYSGVNIYYKQGTSSSIINILKTLPNA